MCMALTKLDLSVVSLKSPTAKIYLSEPEIEGFRKVSPKSLAILASFLANENHSTAKLHHQGPLDQCLGARLNFAFLADYGCNPANTGVKSSLSSTRASCSEIKCTPFSAGGLLKNGDISSRHV